MLLPIPVPVESKENAVRFINLEGYPEFFTDERRLIAELLKSRVAAIRSDRLLSRGLALSPAKESEGPIWRPFCPSEYLPLLAFSLFSLRRNQRNCLPNRRKKRGSDELETPPVY